MRVIQRDTRAQRTGPGMHHENRPDDAELGQRLLDHPALDFGVESASAARVFQPCPGRSIRITRCVSQAVRLPAAASLRDRTCAMQHHDRRTARHAGRYRRRGGRRRRPRPSCPGRDTPAARARPGLRDQRQHPQRHHDDHCHHRMSGFSHQRATARSARGFPKLSTRCRSVDSGGIGSSLASLYNARRHFRHRGRVSCGPSLPPRRTRNPQEQGGRPNWLSL